MKVGDVIYYKWASSWYYQEREIVAETSRSWLVLPVGSPAYMKDQTHWRWPTYCTKLPKNRKNKDGELYTVGTKLDADRTLWVVKYREAVLTALHWEASKMDSYRLLNLAKDLGLDNVVAEYPQEVTNVKEESNQSSAVEVADSDGATKA
jgi:hypothetical protein